VKRLDNGDAEFPAGVIGRRRDERKCVVKMDNVGLPLFEPPMQFIPSARGPNRLKAQSNVGTNASRLNLIVVSKIFVDFVAGSVEKSFFRTDYRVFTTRLLIRIVYDDDLQGRLKSYN
jgi:hypothetical protein